MAETKEQLLEENEALRARIQEIEAELNRAPERPRIFDKQTSEQLRDLPTEVIDQTSRFVRALSLAAIESARVSGEVLAEFANEVFERNKPTGDRRSRDLAVNLSRDIVSAGVNAVGRSLERHRHVVKRFHDSFNEPEPPKEPAQV